MLNNKGLMVARHKLEEAEYFLQKMLETSSEKEFIFNLSS